MKCTRQSPAGTFHSPFRTAFIPKKIEAAGYSLLELMIVMIILGVSAMIVIPNLSSTDPARLELAVSEVMQAIRMARQESVRTASVHGLTVSQTTQKITVKKYDVTTSPVSTDFILTHPVRKQPYVFNINTDSMTQGVLISNSQDAFLFSDSSRRKSLLFDHTGRPIWFFGSTDSIYRLQDGSIELSYRGETRTIKVAALSGRVFEQ